MEYTDWLLTLKEGDEVALPDPYCRRTYKIVRIAHMTPTQLIADDALRINRVNGRVRGDRQHHRRIVAATDRIRAENRKAFLHNWVDGLWRRKPPMDVLEALKTAYDASMAIHSEVK